MVTNPHDHEVTVQHVFRDKADNVLFSFTEVIPPKSSAPYRMVGLETLPPTFDGLVTVYANEPIVLDNLGMETPESDMPKPSELN